MPQDSQNLFSEGGRQPQEGLLAEHAPGPGRRRQLARFVLNHVYSFSRYAPDHPAHICRSVCLNRNERAGLKRQNRHSRVKPDTLLAPDVTAL